MRTQGGGGVKNGQILRTSFMDGPLARRLLRTPVIFYISPLLDISKYEFLIFFPTTLEIRQILALLSLVYYKYNLITVSMPE